MLPDFFYPINYHSIPTLDLTILNLEKYENNLRGRNDLALNPYNKIAGGIDVTTGYSRRTMLQFPYLKLYPPIFLSQLPDWNKFMASNALDISNKYIEHNDNAEINILFIGTIILLCCGIIYYIIKNVSTNL